MGAGIRHQEMLSHARLVEARFSTYRNVDVNRGRGLGYQREEQVGAPPELAAFEEPVRRGPIAEIRIGDGRMFRVKLSHIKRADNRTQILKVALHRGAEVAGGDVDAGLKN